MERDPRMTKGHPERIEEESILNEVIFHHLSDMIFVMKVEAGPSFRYFFVNKAGLEHACFSNSPIGLLLEEVLPEDQAEHLYQYYKRAVYSNEPVIYIDEMANGRKMSNVYETRLTTVKKNENVTYIIGITREIHRNHAEMIEYMELHDQLTGAWNRKALMNHLELEISAAQSTETEFSVIYLDLDRFKHFNDTLGYDAGDDLLKFVTSRLMKINRMGYRLYRLGSDEFVILLLNTDKNDTEEHVQQILDLFSSPFTIQGEDCYITPSIGISMFPRDGKDADMLLKNAHSSLVLIKTQNPGNHHFYQSSMTQTLSNYLIMEAHLRRAIEKDELSLHYQPQVNLKTGAIESFEALLRWNNRKFGAVSPANFIPLAEETGLIVPIGEWVIRKVCDQLADWRDKGYRDIRIAINISPRQFNQWNLPEVIKEKLDGLRLPASSLEIEITEGAMQDTDTALHMLNRLKELGIVLSVDDFGTGYSSLNYLKNFPIDILKIDQSFIKEIEQSHKDAAITKTIIHLAHSLGLEVVAEGVEERLQVEFLTEANCQKAQGFFFSKPVTAQEIEEKVLQQSL